ncbi:oxalate-binding protein [Anaeramoeba ignava]|uniref:Oxalate-binding protein n=1 Tax=Anaeramoeba ignava TaxID=1746090 RepID=A0A9Q0LM87_ANAIG|nr:oxalate-binding protein [Anaeramoeba ignava]
MFVKGTDSITFDKCIKKGTEKFFHSGDGIQTSDFETKTIAVPPHNEKFRKKTIHMEIFFVSSGVGKVRIGSEQTALKRGTHFYIPSKTYYSIENDGTKDLVLSQVLLIDNQK